MVKFKEEAFRVGARVVVVLKHPSSDEKINELAGNIQEINGFGIVIKTEKGPRLVPQTNISFIRPSNGQQTTV